MFFLPREVKTPFFGQEGGCNKTFFLITCVLQNVNSDRFCVIWGQNLDDVENIVKVCISALLENKQGKQ